MSNDEAERLARLAAADKKHLWHPFTPMDEWEAESPPLVIERAEGAYLIDALGRRYLDGVSSLWVNLHGHRKTQIDEAVRAQLARVAHTTQLGMTNPAAIALAEKLTKIAPSGLTRVFYSDAGATAVEVALKMAFQYQKQRKDPQPGKEGFLTLELAYHGDTLGAVSLGGIDLFHQTFAPLLFRTMRAQTPYCLWCPLGAERPPCAVCAGEEIVRQIRENARHLAAVVLEPMVQGAAGMIVQPPGFLARVRQACTENDVLLVADEVATGFGRTGPMFACEHEGVAPDVLCLAKGLTGGYLPLAATLATEEIFDAFRGPPETGRTFFHGHSYTGNPLGCAAALANLEVFERESTIEQNGPKIALLWSELERLAHSPHVGEVRGLGWMVGVELLKNKETKEPYTPAERMGRRVILAARKRGLAVRPLGDVVVLMPPYCVTNEEIVWMVRVLEEAIEEACAPT